MRYLPFDHDRQRREPGELTILRWPDGSLREHGRTLNGRREGVWTRWYEHGQRAEECTYRQGRLHGPMTAWFPTGTVRAELHYQDGRLHGPYATWHPNGNMAEEGEWIEGLPHRDFVRFWPNGRRRLVGVLEHGVPMGLWKVYSHHGVLMYGGEWDPDLGEWLPPWIRAALQHQGARPVLASVG